MVFQNAAGQPAQVASEAFHLLGVEGELAHDALHGLPDLFGFGGIPQGVLQLHLHDVDLGGGRHDYLLDADLLGERGHAVADELARLLPDDGPPGELVVLLFAVLDGVQVAFVALLELALDLSGVHAARRGRARREYLANLGTDLVVGHA